MKCSMIKMTAKKKIAKPVKVEAMMMSKKPMAKAKKK
jgi:hypothetical protein